MSKVSANFLSQAAEYVKKEIGAETRRARIIKTFDFMGQESIVASLWVNDSNHAGFWVIGGSTPIAIYDRLKFDTAHEVFNHHKDLTLQLMYQLYMESSIAYRKTEYDAFICHASEDKQEIALPLAKTLVAKGYNIWLDEFELTVGDSLRESIDKGLSSSRYGIVILSKSFFRKRWPQYELNGLVTKEMQGRKVILPIWHNISMEEISEFSPSLVDKVALNSNEMDMNDMAVAIAGILSLKT